MKREKKGFCSNVFIKKQNHYKLFQYICRSAKMEAEIKPEDVEEEQEESTEVEKGAE